MAFGKYSNATAASARKATQRPTLFRTAGFMLRGGVDGDGLCLEAEVKVYLTARSTKEGLVPSTRGTVRIGRAKEWNADAFLSVLSTYSKVDAAALTATLRKLDGQVEAAHDHMRSVKTDEEYRLWLRGFLYEARGSEEPDPPDMSAPAGADPTLNPAAPAVEPTPTK